MDSVGKEEPGDPRGAARTKGCVTLGTRTPSPTQQKQDLTEPSPDSQTQPSAQLPSVRTHDFSSLGPQMTDSC